MNNEIITAMNTIKATTEEREVKYYRKSVYGTDHDYPNCQLSKNLCKIFGLKTITPDLRLVVVLFGFRLVETIAPR